MAAGKLLLFGLASLVLQPVAALLPGIKPLPQLRIDPDGISISGLSSGADFAVQFQVAFSKTIMGLGVFAGQPFHCAVTRFGNEPLQPASLDVPVCDNCPPGQVVAGDHCKANHSLVNASLLADVARRMSRAGLIDDVIHLKRSKIYTHNGLADPHWHATKATYDFFGELVPAANMLAKFDLPAGHCWPGDTGIFPCKVVLDDFWPAENCGYDGPGEMLKHIYGAALKPPRSIIVEEHLMRFDQRPFNGNDSATVGLSQFGWIYVPEACTNTSSTATPCTLHLSLHGCHEWVIFEEELVRGGHKLGLSFNRWAESNNIVMLWPHIGRHGGKNATSAQKADCWDGYGQSIAYDTQHGVQMQAIQRMIETVSGIQMVIPKSEALDHNAFSIVV